MTAEGYQWTGYDAVQREVDLQFMADLNGLELSEAGTLLLGGSRALRAGPFVDLYRGGYKVTFTISIPQKRALPDAPICTGAAFSVPFL